MVRFYQQVAKKLVILKPLFMLLLLLSLTTFAYFLFFTKAQTQYALFTCVFIALLSAILGLWLHFFTNDLPMSTQKGFWHNAKIGLHRLFYHLLAIVITLLLLSLVFLGVRALLGILLFS